METNAILGPVATLALMHAAVAAEQGYDFVACTHAQRTMIEAGSETVAFGVEVWGIVSSSTTKFWEGASTHCAGYIRITQGRPVGKGTCKWLTAGGDSAEVVGGITAADEGTETIDTTNYIQFQSAVGAGALVEIEIDFTRE